MRDYDVTSTKIIVFIVTHFKCHVIKLRSKFIRSMSIRKWLVVGYDRDVKSLLVSEEGNEMKNYSYGQAL